MTISKRLFANNAKTTLLNAISSTDTLIQVVDGSKFPTPNPGEYFLVTLEFGNNIEIVKVLTHNGGALSGCIRAQENTTAVSFPAGSRVENRLTKGSLDSYEQVADKLKDIDSIDLLDSPDKSNSNTYVCHSNDSSGNPIIAIKNTNSTWKFNTHSTVLTSGAATSGTAVSVVSPGISSLIGALVSGKYIIQFVTGNNSGQCRNLTSSGTNTAGWSTALPNPVVAGDQYEIYLSNASILKDVSGGSGDDGLLFSIIFSD